MLFRIIFFKNKSIVKFIYFFLWDEKTGSDMSKIFLYITLLIVDGAGIPISEANSNFMPNLIIFYSHSAKGAVSCNFGTEIIDIIFLRLYFLQT